jgi:Asp-tRNAAsn/Glu-tRNAGln amidotransferase A subunit and related amidases
MDYTKTDIWDILRFIKSGKVSAEEVTESCLNKAKQTAYLNAFTYVNKDFALENARCVDEKIKNNKYTGILAGIPIGIKDNISTIGMPTSCASNMLKGHFFDFDATVVEKLKEQDAVLLGKTNMDEFAMGSGSNTSAFGRVKHPINTELVPGGSSGGSAVSVAVGSTLAALGTDTGGSVRQPAAYCGITGLKPTYGRISKHGIYPLAPTLDHVGIMTKTVKDNLLVFETIYGKDPADPSTMNCENTNFDTHCLDYTNKNLKIAYLKQNNDLLVDEEIRNTTNKAISFFSNNNYVVEEIDFPLLNIVSSAYSILCCGEVLRNLKIMNGVQAGNLIEHALTFEDIEKASRGEYFGLETKKRLIYGAYVIRSENFEKYYNKARKLRTMIIDYMKNIFRNYDIVLCPTTACTAHRNDRKDNLEQLEFNDVFAVIANFTGRPAITVPSGKDKNGLPIGLQFIGKTYNENDIFNIAYFYEQNIGKEFISRL